MNYKEFELKHLCAYLPYGLKVAFVVREEIRSVDTIRSIYDIENYDDIKLSIGFSDGEHIWMYKPILRPLSDLTKEQNQEIHSLLPNVPHWECFKEEWIKEKCDLSETIIEYAVMCKLIEWHFDVFDLHSKGLCIYYNEL